MFETSTEENNSFFQNTESIFCVTFNSTFFTKHIYNEEQWLIKKTVETADSIICCATHGIRNFVQAPKFEYEKWQKEDKKYFFLNIFC